MLVYAGSYYNLDRARVFGNRLFAEGVRVEEETVEVDLPITVLRFGVFADQGAAEKEATRARDAGLEVLLIKSR